MEKMDIDHVEHTMRRRLFEKMKDETYKPLIDQRVWVNPFRDHLVWENEWMEWCCCCCEENEIRPQQKILGDIFLCEVFEHWSGYQ